MGVFDYKRRATSDVHIGSVSIGSSYPVALQSMTNTSTADVEASVAQCADITAAGADIVRLTAQGVREAEAIGRIRGLLRQSGVTVPLVADIHFNPKAAFAAAAVTDKVRINPGNFVDPGRTFRHLEFTDAEYAAELERIDQTFGPFLDLCREHATAVRIGVNHGSLSDRIMSRYGDTPAGMVESAMEFLRVARRRNFSDIVISIKASNVVVMVETVRRLVRAMDAEDMHFPLHLGVTEAGDGEDGRVKSAVGIGALLADGIGDTIRVSLSEDPAAEIPVARALRDYVTARASAPALAPGLLRIDGYDPVTPARIPSSEACGIGGTLPTAIISPLEKTIGPHVLLTAEEVSTSSPIDAAISRPDLPLVLATNHPDPVGAIRAAVHTLRRRGVINPVVPRLDYSGVPDGEIAIRAAADFGALLLDGIRDAIWIEAEGIPAERLYNLALTILQAARIRFSRTEYIACPGCGRTMFDLQSTLHDVREATRHLKGLKIGVMGCIVNGPGEMADADYGYVGAAAGRISLYRGKECVAKNIPQDQAIPRLVALLRECGDWRDPE